MHERDRSPGHTAPRRPRRGLRRLAQASIVVAIATCCAASAPLPVRLALVIGNGNYAYNDPLPNALSDAHKLADRLADLGFEVQPATSDLDKTRLATVLGDFGSRLQAAGPNSVGFFYYAGHAAQDSYGVNFLLPIDAQARNPDEVRAEGTPLQPLLKAMEAASNPVNIVVLDACRSWYPSDSKSQDRKGLHDMGQHASVLIAYATRADTTADEGADASSSPFSRRLIEALETHQGDAVVLMFDDVKTLVYSDTESAQAPLLVDGLTISGRWSFKSGAFTTVADKPKATAAVNPVSPVLAGLDRKRLVDFFKGRESFADAMLKRRDVLERFGIDTPGRLAYFLGSVGFETGGFVANEEKFGRVGDPVAIANAKYAFRLGNGSAQSGDGWRFRGRGVYGFFITGRDNYRRFGKAVGVNLIEAPELVNDYEIGLAVAAALWHDYKLNEAADENSIEKVIQRLRTNGTPKEAKARMTWVDNARRAVEPASRVAF